MVWAGGGVGGDDSSYNEHHISLFGAPVLQPHSMVIWGHGIQFGDSLAMLTPVCCAYSVNLCRVA